MGKYEEKAKKIPWSSLGKETVLSKAGLSLLPIGIFTNDPPESKIGDEVQLITKEDNNFEDYLMNIIGTGIQSGDGKLVTCAHVVEEIDNKKGFILSRFVEKGVTLFGSHSFSVVIRYIDPRSGKGNPEVDLAVIISLPKITNIYPHRPPSVKWGDSSKLGVGDPVIIGGYPLGKQMFLLTKTNRGIIQPTFYEGIVSAILPATKPEETRLIQITAPSMGGISGGAMFNPKSGKVLGVVTSGAEDSAGNPLPITYVLPSEIIAPYVEAINYNVEE